MVQMINCMLCFFITIKKKTVKHQDSTIQQRELYPISYTKDFSEGPVVKTLPFKAGGEGLIPGQGTKIPHAQGQKPKHKTETIL